MIENYNPGEWIILVVSAIIILVFLWSLTRREQAPKSDLARELERLPYFRDKNSERKMATQFCLKRSLSWAFAGACCFYFRLLLDYLDPYGLGMIFFIVGLGLWLVAFRWLLKALVVNF